MVNHNTNTHTYINHANIATLLISSNTQIHIQWFFFVRKRFVFSLVCFNFLSLSLLDLWFYSKMWIKHKQAFEWTFLQTRKYGVDEHKTITTLHELLLLLFFFLLQHGWRWFFNVLFFLHPTYFPMFLTRRKFNFCSFFIQFAVLVVYLPTYTFQRNACCFIF